MFKLTDDILAPQGFVVVSYSGPNPFSAYGALDSMMKKIFEGRGANMYEPDFRWDMSSDPSEFYFVKYFEKSLDKFTEFRVTVKGQGKQPKDPTKNGDINLTIIGTLTTKINNRGKFKDRAVYPFIVAYMYSFYNNIRRKYMETILNKTLDLEKQLKEFLKMPVEAQ